MQSLDRAEHWQLQLALRSNKKRRNRPDQRLRRGGAGRQVRRRRRDHGLSDPAVHGDDDGAGADGGQRRARRRVHRRRQRAFAVEHRARRLVERRARLHRQLGRRRAVRLRALLADLRQPHAGADDDCRPHARSAGDFGSEHTDALSTRDMGWLMGWSCDAQEAFDNHLHGVPHRRGSRACCCRRWSARTASSSRTSRPTASCPTPGR